MGAGAGRLGRESCVGVTSRSMVFASRLMPREGAPDCGRPRLGPPCGAVGPLLTMQRRPAPHMPGVAWSVVQQHAQQRAVDLQVAVVLDEAQSPELVHEM